MPFGFFSRRSRAPSRSRSPPRHRERRHHSTDRRGTENRHWVAVMDLAAHIQGRQSYPPRRDTREDRQLRARFLFAVTVAYRTRAHVNEVHGISHLEALIALRDRTQDMYEPRPRFVHALEALEVLISNETLWDRPPRYDGARLPDYRDPCVWFD